MVPAAIAVNTPDEEPIVPVPAVTELHVPLPVLLLKAAVRPEHTVVLPLIADGRLLMVTVFVAVQPAGKV